MRRLVLALCVIATAACGTDGVALMPTTTTSPPSSTTTTTTTSTTTTAMPSTTTSTTQPADPVFTSSVRVTDPDELGVSWRDGCPVPFEQLRWVELAHWDDEGEVRTGVLVIHADHVDDVITVFDKLFEARFPIASMRPITDFDGDDNASMQANNSSAFNCRVIDGTSTWSQHAYGGAIDINPLVNPWVRGDEVDPSEGAPYVDRTRTDVPGLIVAGDVVTEAFAAIGWGWGGDWNNSLDYQHFSHNGR